MDNDKISKRMTFFARRVVHAADSRLKEQGWQAPCPSASRNIMAHPREPGRHIVTSNGDCSVRTPHAPLKMHGHVNLCIFILFRFYFKDISWQFRDTFGQSLPDLLQIQQVSFYVMPSLMQAWRRCSHLRSTWW